MLLKSLTIIKYIYTQYISCNISYIYIGKYYQQL